MADALLITNKPHKVDTVCQFGGIFLFPHRFICLPKTLFLPAHPSVQVDPVYYTQKIQNRREFA